MLMSEEKPCPRDGTDPPWARLLFGDDPWPILLIIVAGGFLLYILARDALPAILGVVVIGLTAHAWLMRRDNRDRADPDDEEQP